MTSRELARALGLRRPLRFGSLRRLSPVSDHWGFDRGLPIDRYYIDQFLAHHRQDIRGRVLEVKDAGYARRFGQGVSAFDVLDVDPSNSSATIVADLADPAALPEAAFDCFILTQTLQFVYEVEAAIRSAHKVLRMGGVLLATVPAVSKIDGEPAADHDFWRFTPASCRRLFAAVFGDEHMEVHAYGNVFAAACFLMGLAREDVTDNELDAWDDRFPVTLAIRATRA